MVTGEAIFRSARGPRVLVLLDPVAMVRNLWRHRELTLQMARREIASRYRTSYLGMIWAALTPLWLLAIYTFVFAVVFKAKWGRGGGGSTAEFGLTLFCGLIVFNLFSETINRATTLVASNPNYVKKVVFPLETFVVSILLASLFTMVVSVGVWLVGMLLIVGVPPVTALWFPVVVLPVCLMTCGLSWVLASLGVFLRDVGHAVLLITHMLFFLTPIFYRVEIVPPKFQAVMWINPLTHAVQDARRVLMWAETPDWSWWAASMIAAALVALGGYAFFMKSKRAFADVI
jgi:lipopolysaccharide transport system permease protein